MVSMTAPAKARDHLIWSHKHGGAWWREASAGYTTDILAAGLYTEAQARDQEERSGSECVAVPVGLAFGIVNAERQRVAERAEVEARRVEYWARHPDYAFDPESTAEATP